MKYQLKKQSSAQKGFTIIEVLIVLAIAGLIMLIVFLAVPALQRNSRNTQRRNDVASYLGAVNEFISNNNGKVPSTSADVSTISNLAKTSLLTKPTALTTPVTQTTTVAIDTMQLIVGAKCSTTTIGDTSPGSNRQIAVRFSVENSTGGAVEQCQES